MRPSDNCYSLIKSFEGFKDKAYQDIADVWTIGYGTTHYPNKEAVKENDECTEEQALEYLKNDVQSAVNTINHLKWNVPLNQSQFDSLVSFQYNTGNLQNSTLYKKASVNPNDETIYKYNPENLVDSCEFLRWIRVHGKISNGLINRRKAEADLYAQ